MKYMVILFGLVCIMVSLAFVGLSVAPEAASMKGQKVFTTYISINFNVPKFTEAFVDEITKQGYTETSIMQVPRYTDALVYDNKGNVDHTVQCVTGFDVIAIGTK